MSSEKLSKLETFIERHRPDFDAHEPGADLWARLEQQLGQPGAGVGPVRLAEPDLVADLTPAAFSSQLAAAVPATSARPRHLARYGVAAALAALVMAAIFREARRPTPAGAIVAAPAETPDASVPADAAYLGPTPQALAAGQAGAAADPRLTVAVQGMETYYAAQLGTRQAELRQLDARNPAADWPRELASLDSSYRQLKEELPHHPQPEVVLTAMNRNLQIRLDILDQQLQHRSAAPETEMASGGTMVSLADSRPQP